MKKVFALFLILSLVFLSGCGHEHTWQEASCTQPKTCTECGETEGEPLGHSPTEATVWESSVCSVCGEVLGEKLPPAFERHNIEVLNITEMSTEFFTDDHAEYNQQGGYIQAPQPLVMFSTGDYSKTKTVPGYLRLADYSIIESDENHEGLEGYEWRIASFDIIFPDTYSGYSLAISDEDYYNIEDHDDSAQGSHYTVTWQGENYDGCVRIIDYGNTNPDYTMPVTGGGFAPIISFASRTVSVAFRVPVGYDGSVVCFRDSTKEFERGQYIYDVKHPGDVFIRLN